MFPHQFPDQNLLEYETVPDISVKAALKIPAKQWAVPNRFMASIFNLYWSIYCNTLWYGANIVPSNKAKSVKEIAY